MGLTTQISQSMAKRRIVVIGNGMVGCRVIERLVQTQSGHSLEVATFCEEPTPAYDRVHLSEYFKDATAEDLTLKPVQWDLENDVHLLLGHRVKFINREDRYVESSKGLRVPSFIVFLIY